MAWQDPTTIDWTNGLVGLWQYVNSVTNGWVSNMILIGVYIISLMGYYRTQEDFAGGCAIAGIIVFIFGLLFFVANTLDWVVFGITIALAVIGVVVLIVDRNRSYA